MTIALSLDDEESPYARAVLAIPSCAFIAPAVWRSEVANVLVVAERRGRLADAAAAMHALLRDYPVTVVASTQIVAEIVLAKKHKLSVYDVAYLALAIAERAPLATLDAKLARAAEAEGLYFNP